MRLLFMDENDKPGLLYQGKIYPHAKEIIAAKYSQKEVIEWKRESKALQIDGMLP